MTSRQPEALSVDVAELRGRPGALEQVDRVLEAPEGLSTVLIGVPVGSELELQMRLESVHEGVLLTGEVRTRVAGQCGRCLDEIGYPLTVDLMQLFSWPEKAVETAPAEDGDDEERVVSEDLTIALEPVLRDLLVSALPFQPVCRPDCPGLCSQCGFRLEDDPEHAHEQLDPRWSALAGLAEELSEENSES